MSQPAGGDGPVSMRMAVVGGTGTLGRHIVDALRARRHEVRVLSRTSPDFRVDLTTGDGLERALQGCETVIDASNNTSKAAAAILVDGSRRLLNAEREAGVRHHVCVSIVGCDLVPTSYFKVKVEQERTTEHGGVPWTIVRATQFHELVIGMLAALGSWRVLPLPRGPLQPIAAADAARAIATFAEGPPLLKRVNVAGPQIVDVRGLARVWLSHGGRGLLVPIPLPGAIGRALRAGGLTCDRPDVRGTIPFEAALAHPT
jgi:uncharacterized protein YbjT (DUF2867 family)